MYRRHFIALIGAAGAATGMSAVNAAAAWRPDGAATRARIGVLTPDFDPVPESELWTMAPHGVSIHTSRVPAHTGSFADPPQLDDAADLLMRIQPRAIVCAYTSSSYDRGARADEALQVRLEKRIGGIPLILTAPTATTAFRSLGAHRVALVHPPWFTDEMNERGRDYFRAAGCDVVSCTRIAPARSFAEVKPDEVFAWTKANVPREAQAVFIGGNGLRAIGAIAGIERSLGRPVLTANQVIFWRALQIVGMTLPVHKYGRIFATP
jgi:maleate isomerase